MQIADKIFTEHINVGKYCPSQIMTKNGLGQSIKKKKGISKGVQARSTG